MYARAVDEAAERLHALRSEEREDFGLATVVLAFAVAAGQFLPALAIPLFLGGVFVGGLGLRALWRRWDLVDRLVGQRDAYAISEVRARASSAATMERRRRYAASIRCRLREPGPLAGIAPVADELGALVSELEDGELELEPAAAVACARLLTDVAESPLLNPALSPEDLSSRVRRIRAGFSLRAAAA